MEINEQRKVRFVLIKWYVEFIVFYLEMACISIEIDKKDQC